MGPRNHGVSKMQIISRKVRIPVFLSKERKSYVAYSPALDLSSCGRTLAQAQKRFSGAVGLFLDELEAMGTLDQVLTELGWQKQEHPRKEWIPPHLLKHTQMEVTIPVHA